MVRVTFNTHHSFYLLGSYFRTFGIIGNNGSCRKTDRSVSTTYSNRKVKLVWFTGLWWFCVPLVVGIGYEEITGTFIQNNQIMDGIFTILWYACYVLCPLNFLQNIIRMVKKDRKFSFLELLLHNRQKKGFEAKLGGDTVALKTAKDLSGVVFGKSNGKYATMPESTDGHILIVGGAGSGKTAAVAIPTLMSWKERVFAIDIKGELYEKTKKARGEATIKVFNPTDRNAYGYDPFYMLKTKDNIIQVERCCVRVPEWL